MIWIGWILLANSIEALVVQSWVWGPDVPKIIDSLNEDLDVPADYPDYGFIQLQKIQTDWISINMVKRPPHHMYSRTKRFCSEMLPAAMTEFMRMWNMNEVAAVSVYILAEPYMAACKCYLGTMVSMGLTRIEGNSQDRIANSTNIESLCEREKYVSVTARPAKRGATGYAPANIGNTELDLLRESVDFVRIDTY